MNSFVPVNCPALRRKSKCRRSAEKPAITAGQVAVLAGLSVLSWGVLLSPFLLRL
jgi:hypothetical protein